MVNVFNNTAMKITCENIVIESGHNYLSYELWASISSHDEIRELIKDNSLLVENHNDYVNYTGAIDTLFSYCISAEIIAGIKAEKDKANKLKNATDTLNQVESSEITLEILHDDFANDIKTQKKYALIMEKLPEIKAELNKIIQG